MSDGDGFAGWYERLMRHGMGGAACGAAGIGLGIGMVLASRVLAEPYVDHIATAGVFMVRAGAAVFTIFGIAYVISYVWTTYKSAQGRTRRGRRPARRQSSIATEPHVGSDDL